MTKFIRITFFDYSDAHILARGNITVTRTIAAAAAGGNAQRKQPLNATTEVVFKNLHHLKIVEQKLTRLLLIMQILLI